MLGCCPASDSVARPEGGECDLTVAGHRHGGTGAQARRLFTRREQSGEHAVDAVGEHDFVAKIAGIALRRRLGHGRERHRVAGGRYAHRAPGRRAAPHEGEDDLAGGAGDVVADDGDVSARRRCVRRRGIERHRVGLGRRCVGRGAVPLVVAGADGQRGAGDQEGGERGQDGYGFLHGSLLAASSSQPN